MVTAVGTGGARRALIVGASVVVVCSLPVFFVGAMAVELTRDLGFGEVGIGGAVATFFATMAVSSIHLGRLVDRLGATLAMRIAVLGAGTASLGVALLAANWPTLAAWLVLSGLSAALAQPAANRLLVNRVRMARLGTAFGLKQSAPPTASMLAGLSVPVIALTIGWRWAYGIVAGVAVLAAVAVGSRPAVARRTTSAARGEKLTPLRDRATLVMLAGAFGLAFIASSAVLAFYVDAAVSAGVRSRDAGLVFALGSLTAIGTRLVSGVATDRFTFRPLRLCAGLLAAGAVGIALLATGRPTAMAVGAVIALAGTWGFPGLFWFALVTAYPETPGRVTGAMAPAALGGVVGPVGFGALAATAGYPSAWRVAGLLAVCAAAGLYLAAQRLGAGTHDVEAVG